MEIEVIVEQLTTTYGHPIPIALLQNETLFRSVYCPLEAPEELFCQIKDCQENQILRDNPYPPMQLLNNAIWLLLGCSLYQRDFEAWDCKLPAIKMWLTLKPFIQEAYQHHLNTTSITAGQHRYAKCLRSSCRGLRQG